jgi:hypothetical protein
MKHFASRAFWEAYDRLPSRSAISPTGPSLVQKSPRGSVVTRNGAADRGSIKNCESLHALLLRHFKALRHFGESFLAVKHARGKIGDRSPTKCGLRRVGIIVVVSRV